MNGLPGAAWPDSRWAYWPIVSETFRGESEKFLDAIPSYKGHTQERGIIICAGGVKLFTNAWICINMLRHHGCELPIQIWHLGLAELDDTMAELVRPYGVECVDAYKIRAQEDDVRICNGYEVKPFSLKHCKFKEVLLIDADNCVCVDPTSLFDSDEFLQTGTLFWPDYGRLEPTRIIWKATGVRYQDEPEVESGQILIDRELAWKPLCLAGFYNEYSDFLFQHIHGDKETFHLAWRKCNYEYAMPRKGIHSLQGTMCQHDFSDDRIFQHRNMEKWLFGGHNNIVEDFWYEDLCFDFLAQLKEKWDGVIRYKPPGPVRTMVDGVTPHGKEFLYERKGYDRRVLSLRSDGGIGQGAASNETTWAVFEVGESSEIWFFNKEGNLTCRLYQQEEGKWTGRWEVHEKCEIVMLELDKI